jgi:hypothetical protein
MRTFDPDRVPGVAVVLIDIAILTLRGEIVNGAQFQSYGIMRSTERRGPGAHSSAILFASGSRLAEQSHTSRC